MFSPKVKVAFGVASGSALALGVLALNAYAQTVNTWTASDTDAVQQPAFDQFKTYIKWFLIAGIPILLALHFLFKFIGVLFGRAR